MSQTTELARVKARIRALTEKTVSNGCTEAEALAAAEMVGRLLERYSLTMREVDVRQTPCVEVAVMCAGRRRRPIDGCVTAIARFCDCRVWVTRTDVALCYVFFGFETDAMLARYLYQVIEAAIATECTAFRARRPRLRGLELRRASDSFQHGMAARVAERLEAMHAERSASVAAQRTDGTALVLVKHGVVEAAFQQTGMCLTDSRSLVGPVVGSAFRHGQEAGERVNLNRPLTTGAPALLE